MEATRIGPGRVAAVLLAPRDEPQRLGSRETRAHAGPPGASISSADASPAASADEELRPALRTFGGGVAIALTPSISRRSSVSARFATSTDGQWWMPSPLFARKRATPVVSSVGSTSSIFDSPTRQNAIRPILAAMSSDDVGSQAERVAPEGKRRVEGQTTTATWWTARAGGRARALGSRKGGRASRQSVQCRAGMSESATVNRGSASRPRSTDLRRAHDRSARLGVPAHVTILYRSRTVRS